MGCEALPLGLLSEERRGPALNSLSNTLIRHFNIEILFNNLCELSIANSK